MNELFGAYIDLYESLAACSKDEAPSSRVVSDC